MVVGSNPTWLTLVRLRKENTLELIKANLNIYHELDRLYGTPENTWVLVRQSAMSSQAEILADMIYLRDQMVRLLNELGEAWHIEIQAQGRKIYMKRETA